MGLNINKYESQKRRNESQAKDEVIRGIPGFKDHGKQCHNPGARGEYQAERASYREASEEELEKILIL